MSYLEKMFNIKTPSNICKCRKCSDKTEEKIDIEELKKQGEIMIAAKLEVSIKKYDTKA